jgi:signal transduction histidine kinase
VLDGAVTLRLSRPHRDDVLIAVAGLLGGLLLWSLGLYIQDRELLPSWATLLPLAVIAALELLRRTAPRTAVLVGTAAMIGDQFTRGNLVTVMMFTDLLYAAVVYGTPALARRIPVVTGLISVAATLTYVAWFQDPLALLFGVATALITFFPAVTGAIVRNHRETAIAARLRAEQTALLAEMDRTQAVIAERARMARELHDMVANHLSAIAIHSTAALSLDDPRTTKKALTVIRENSVEGLAEMRRLIGLLRDAGGDAEPSAAPTLDGLASLLVQARASGAPSGLTFVLNDEARPDGAARLPAPVEMAAYRIVQESLTNAVKHAAPGEVRVILTRGKPGPPGGRVPPGEVGGPLIVLVTSPYGNVSGPRAPGSGAGLIGMGERVALLGGEFEAGPADGAAGKFWHVRAVLPLVEGRAS